MQTIDCAVIGVGNVGRNLLRILETKAECLRDDYGLHFRVILATDSSGAAVDVHGFDPARLRTMKELSGRVIELPGALPMHTPAEALGKVDVQLVFEASPVNLVTGDPGLSATRAALSRGMDVVLANKAPLVLAYRELHELAAAHGARLAFSATVCGALPVINIGRRDLVAAEIGVLRGIFNSTSNFILGEMAAGRSYADALAEAQARGIAETDPSLDVDGWDTANKLVILANAVLRVPAALADVEVVGIRGLTPEALERAQAQGRTIKLVASAVRGEGGYRLCVGPTALARDEFLGRCDGWEMGVEIVSDLYGRQMYKIWERDPLPTAAAMLRDAVNLYV